MIRILTTLFFLHCACALLAQSIPDTLQKQIPNRLNTTAQQQKPYVILISADGFRYDMADKYQATTLINCRNTGITTKSMKPSFPSLTFPNHYTIATGLYPSHHGIVNNSFYDTKKKAMYYIGSKAVRDSSWYGGTPIWTLAEQQGMLSASFFWVGSEAAIKGVRPTYYYTYSTAIPLKQRVDAVRNWLTLPEEKRPHLITFYISDVDHEAHHTGPGSVETANAVKLVDHYIAALTRVTDSLKLPVNYIFVSDHGMVEVDTSKPTILDLPGIIDTSKFVIPRGSVLMHLYAKDKAAIEPAYTKLKANAKQYDVYRATEIPARWHFSTTDDRYQRIGDIIIVAKSPYIIPMVPKGIKGMHGYDNDEPDMQATFYAWGPAFKPTKLSTINNIDIYPLIAKILGLTITEKIDGSIQSVKKALK